MGVRGTITSPSGKPTVFPFLPPRENNCFPDPFQGPGLFHNLLMYYYVHCHEETDYIYRRWCAEQPPARGCGISDTGRRETPFRGETISRQPDQQLGRVRSGRACPARCESARAWRARNRSADGLEARRRANSRQLENKG